MGSCGLIAVIYQAIDLTHRFGIVGSKRKLLGLASSCASCAMHFNADILTYLRRPRRAGRKRRTERTEEITTREGEK